MFKIGKMKAKNIVNGILIVGLIYGGIMLLSVLSYTMLIPGTLGDSGTAFFVGIMELISRWSVPILGIVLLKLICEALYKILRAAEIIIDQKSDV